MAGAAPSLKLCILKFFFLLSFTCEVINSSCVVPAASHTTPGHPSSDLDPPVFLVGCSRQAYLALRVNIYMYMCVWML